MEATQPGGAVVDTDVGCVGCDYNLRGLDVAGSCPECGVSVASGLEAAERAWPAVDVAAWRRACRLIGASGFVTAALPVPLLMTWFLGTSGFTTAGLWVLLCGGVLVEHGLWAAGLAKLSRVAPVVRHIGLAAAGRLRWLGWLNFGLAALAVALPVVGEAGYLDGNWWGPAWGGVVLLALGVRWWAVCVGSRALSGTLRAAGRSGRARHVRITRAVVLLVCGVQGLATAATLFYAALDTDVALAVAIPLGIGSFFALPLVAGWAAFSVLQAAWAFGQNDG
ncbi:MAG: hypothetical protein AAF710_06595 [Planctomycetota bacterium]